MFQSELMNYLVETMGDVLTPDVLEKEGAVDANYSHLHTLKVIGTFIGQQSTDYNLAAKARLYQRGLEDLYPDHFQKHGQDLKNAAYKPLGELKENAEEFTLLLENANAKFKSLNLTT